MLFNIINVHKTILKLFSIYMFYNVKITSSVCFRRVGDDVTPEVRTTLITKGQ